MEKVFTVTKIINEAHSNLAKKFKRDGFVCPISAFSEAEAKDYRQQLEKAEALFGTREEFNYGLRRDSNLLLPFVDEITRRQEITDIISKILGPNLLVLDVPFFIKEPNTSSFVSWHQDLHYWGLETEEEVTAWLALSPATVDSGCMRFVSGSQNQRIEHRDTFGDNNLLTRGQEVIVDVDESIATEAELKPGQFSIHHGRVFHASHPNHSEDRRIGIAIRYIPTNARQLPGSNMAAMLVRGEDQHGNFRLCRPPSGIMEEKDIQYWSQIASERNKVMMDP